MKTDIANSLSEHLIAESNRLKQMAALYAVQYAETDDKASKAAYEKYALASEELRKLHPPLCNVLHALEAMIPEQKEHDHSAPRKGGAK